jgi:hypothetical protein
MVHATLVKDFGWNPVSLHYTAKSLRGPLSYRLDVKEFTEAAAGVFFPTRVSFERRAGDVERRAEDVTIDVRSINAPIDPKVFTIAGMNIPAGTPVNAYPDEDIERLAWNGERIVPAAGGGPAFGNTGQGFGVFYVFAAVFAIVAVMAGLWSMRSRLEAGTSK